MPPLIKFFLVKKEFKPDSRNRKKSSRLAFFKWWSKSSICVCVLISHPQYKDSGVFGSAKTFMIFFKKNIH
jgi:hypothetical protein